MGSPPKPWERNGAAPALASSTSVSVPAPSQPTSTSTSAPSSSSQPPTLPDRPPALSSSLTTTQSQSQSQPYNSSPYSRLGTSYGGYGGYGSTLGGYGSLGMGGYGGMGMGSYGSYGGYGGYGSGYGGMGMGMGMGGYGGYGSMGMGMGMSPYGGVPPGMTLDANGQPIPSLTQTLESTTAHTFALLHSIVQTFTGVAQMLESTFMATHSSFFAMVGVVDQFGQLRNALGSVLGLFGLLRWVRELISGPAPLPGQLPGGGTLAMNDEFKAFINGKPVYGPRGPPPSPQAQARASKKPLIIFLLAIFGIPWAMTKLVRILTERARLAQAQAQAQGMGMGLALGGGPVQGLLMGANGMGIPNQVDPTQLVFARALYPFKATTQAELALKENEIVAVLARLDPRTGVEVAATTPLSLSADPSMPSSAPSSLPTGAGGESQAQTRGYPEPVLAALQESEWWKGRTREGREGWFPRKWVEVLERKAQGQVEGKKID